MVKKQIRLTEAKIAEMAVEVAKRALTEDGIRNRLHNTTLRHGEATPFTDDIIDKEKHDTKIAEYGYLLNKIREEGIFYEKNPEAFTRAWRLYLACANKSYYDDIQCQGMMEDIERYINRYEIYAKQAQGQH